MPPRPSPTHFLCIPLASQQLAKSIASFRADVVNPNTFNIPDGAVRPLGTLHLTLGVMFLGSDTLDTAIELLKSLNVRSLWAEVTSSRENSEESRSSGIASASPTTGSSLSISIRGLHSMQLAAKSTVLYAPPLDPEGHFYEFCKRLRKPFQQSGLMIDEGRPLLLHATLVNTIYAKGRGRGSGGRRERLTIDARDILNRYADHVWADDVPITGVAICRMGAKQIPGTDDAAYEVEAQVGFDG